MSSVISSVVVNARTPQTVAAFWCAVLGWQTLEVFDGGIAIGPPGGGGGPTMDVVLVHDPVPGPNRLHLDLRADGPSTAAELERLLGLGARRVDVGQPADATWVVLADPEGNEFCLLARSAEEVVGTG